MPGPSNKQKAKSRGKNQKRTSGNFSKPPPAITECDESRKPHNDRPSPPSSPSPPALKTPSPVPVNFCAPEKQTLTLGMPVPKTVEEVLFQEPFIYDPGNGPRVRGARAFMSSFFAQPPALEDPLCAEFAQEEVFQMLCTVLPEETALIVWYNKSRSHSRVCPACQRLYRVGDPLPDLVDKQAPTDKQILPQLLREQSISGLCSPVCFIVASFNYPGAIKSAWGCMSDDMDDDAWDQLNGPGETITTNHIGRTLGMVVKMTRLHDLGLAQLCFDADETSLLQAAGAELDLGPTPIWVS